MNLSNLPVPKNEDERLKALYSYDILDTEYDAQFDRLVQLASQICETPISLISLIDSDRQWFKSKTGLDATETPRSISFCQFAIMEDELFMVENATTDDRFKENPLVTGNPNIRFYAGQPLIDKKGFALGTLCVIDEKPKTLSASQQEALKILADQITHTIQLKKAQKEKAIFHKFFNLSLNAMCIANQEGKFLRVNPTLCKILGYSENELHSSSFFDFIHQEDIEKSRNALIGLNNGEELQGSLIDSLRNLVNQSLFHGTLRLTKRQVRFLQLQMTSLRSMIRFMSSRSLTKTWINLPTLSVMI